MVKEHLRGGIPDCLLGGRCGRGRPELLSADDRALETKVGDAYLGVNVDDYVVASVGHFEDGMRPMEGSPCAGLEGGGRWAGQ